MADLKLFPVPRSKKRFIKALLVLMEQYDFKDITITQISQEAGLSRKTFYRLFKDKEELLYFFFEKLYKECLIRIRSRQLRHYWDVVQCYFDFFGERKELLSLLKENNLSTLLFEGSYKYSFKVFEYVRSKETAEAYSSFLPYLPAYSTGGMYSMLLKWVEGDMSVPSSRLIEILKTGLCRLKFETLIHALKGDHRISVIGYKNARIRGIPSPA